ncbi:MAG: transporter substrate-binding domain-containing protein [Candidatus Thiodiazotropha sp.]
MTIFIKCLESYKIVVVIVLLSLVGASYAKEETIVQFISSETPPFWSETLETDGMCGEILHEISNHIGVKSVIEYEPTTRIVERVGHNLLGNPGLFLSSHDFSSIIPIAVFRLALFYYEPHHNEGITFNRLEDLKGYTIGIIKGSLSNADIAYFRESGVEFEESYSKESLFKKMMLGRIDLCIEIELSGLLILNRLFPDKADEFTRIELQRSITPITIMIDDSYPDGQRLGENITKGLEMIINNGKYQEILEKYYGKGNIPADWFSLLEQYRQMYGLSAKIH